MLPQIVFGGMVLRNFKLHWRRLIDQKSITLHGVTVGTAQSDVPRNIRSALFKETYEAYECEMVKARLNTGDKVLEIGTGIGLVSLVASRICGEGNVFSYEANPTMETTIRANYALNNQRPELVMKAVTSDGRDLTFFQDSKVLSSSVYDRGLGSAEITVKSVAIAGLISRHKPTVLLMDVEGAELELLRAPDLAQIRTIIVEMHPHIVGQTEIADLVSALTAQGFKLAETRHKTYLLIR